jgi:hypothetical protein
VTLLIIACVEDLPRCLDRQIEGINRKTLRLHEAAWPWYTVLFD